MAKRCKLKSTSETENDGQDDKQKQSGKQKPDKQKQPAPIVPVPGEIGAQLLYDRDQSGHLLHLSKSSLRRAEKNNKLHPVRPTGSPTGKAFYSGAELLALIRGGARDA
jgi:hypothetical protein